MRYQFQLVMKIKGPFGTEERPFYLRFVNADTNAYLNSVCIRIGRKERRRGNWPCDVTITRDRYHTEPRGVFGSNVTDLTQEERYQVGLISKSNLREHRRVERHNARIDRRAEYFKRKWYETGKKFWKDKYREAIGYCPMDMYLEDIQNS